MTTLLLRRGSVEIFLEVGPRIGGVSTWRLTAGWWFGKCVAYGVEDERWTSLPIVQDAGLNHLAKSSLSRAT